MRSKYGADTVLLQEDGASYHRFRGWGLWEYAADLRKLDWPVQSPDLSLIENIWCEMKLCISKQKYRIYSEEDFKVVIMEMWEGIGPEIFKKYADTMPKRLALLKKARGSAIKY